MSGIPGSDRKSVPEADPGCRLFEDRNTGDPLEPTPGAGRRKMTQPDSDQTARESDLQAGGMVPLCLEERKPADAGIGGTDLFQLSDFLLQFG